MKTVGLIGGTSWLSTVDYYRIINQTVNEKLGELNSAKLYLYSLNFDEIKKLTDAGKWSEISKIICGISKKLEIAGADCIILCANTLHKFSDDVKKGVNIPLIHIAEATAKEIKNRKLKKVALLGTKYTMEEDFFKNKLTGAELETLIPNDEERKFINYTIFEELGKDIFKEETKLKYIEIINNLTNRGAEGIILGCTEIPLLIKQSDCTVPVFDTIEIHAKAAVGFVLNN